MCYKQIAIAIIIVAIVILLYGGQQTASEGARIYRTSSAVNTANETPLGAGIIHSVPVMNMLHTYWDGTEYRSCDECSSGYICPRCPKFASAVYERADLDEGFKNTRESVGAYKCGGCPAPSRSGGAVDEVLMTMSDHLQTSPHIPPDLRNYGLRVGNYDYREPVDYPELPILDHYRAISIQPRAKKLL